MKFHLASIASTAFGTINSGCLIREHLESHLSFNHCQNLRTQLCLNQWQGYKSHLAATMFNSFKNAFDSPNVLFSPTKSFATGNFL